MAIEQVYQSAVANIKFIIVVQAGYVNVTVRTSIN
jgi:hypothetical protein